MKNICLNIRTPDSLFFSGAVSCVTVLQEDGVRQILPGHEGAVCTIAAGNCSFVSVDGLKHDFVVDVGLLCVAATEVTVFSTRAVWGKDFEKAAAERQASYESVNLRRKEAHNEYVRSNIELAKALPDKGNKHRH